MATAEVDDLWDLQISDLYRAHSAEVRSLVRRRVSSRDLVDDIVQETFLRLHRYRGRLDPERPVLPLLRTIAGNLCIDAARARRRHPEEPPPAQDLADVSWQTDPARRTDAREQRDAILSAFGAISPREARMLVYREIDGLSYRAIADAESISDDAVKSALKRARASFRTAYLHVAESVLGVLPLAAISRGRRTIARRLNALSSSPGLRSGFGIDLVNVVGVLAVAAGVATGPMLGSDPAHADGATHHPVAIQPATAALDDDRHTPAFSVLPRGAGAPQPTTPVVNPPIATGADIESDGDWVSVSGYVEGFLPVPLESETDVRFTCGNQIRRAVCDAAQEHDPEPGDEET